MRCDVLKRSVALWVYDAIGPVAVAAFIAARRAGHGIPDAVACRALGVSESWFYKWKDGDRSARRARRERLKAEIARLFARRKGKDGSPRITADAAGGRLDGEQEHRRGVDGRDGPGRPAEGQAARRHDPAGEGRGGGRRTWSSGTSRRRPPSTVKWYGDGTEIRDR